MDWQTINSRYRKLSGKWQDTVTDLSIKTKPDPLGGYFLDLSKDGEAALAFMERGNITSREVANSLDGILYIIFRNQAKARGLEYEIAHRVPKQDFRRLYFQKSVEELGKISNEWAKILEREFETVLKKHPFVDDR